MPILNQRLLSYLRCFFKDRLCDFDESFLFITHGFWLEWAIRSAISDYEYGNKVTVSEVLIPNTVNKLLSNCESHGPPSLVANFRGNKIIKLKTEPYLIQNNLVYRDLVYRVLNRVCRGRVVIHAIPHRTGSLKWLLFLVKNRTRVRIMHGIKMISVSDISDRLKEIQKLDGSPHNLENYIKFYILHVIPIELYERFIDLDQEIKLKYKGIDGTVSAAAILNDIPFKILSANVKKNGGRIVGMAHGGDYGLYNTPTPEESYEIKVSTEYFYWSRGPRNNRSFLPLPIKSTPKSNGDRVLIVLPDFKSMSLYYSTLANGSKNYYLADVSYVKKCEFIIRKMIDSNIPFDVRIQSKSIGSDFHQNLLKEYPNIKYNKGRNVITEFSKYQFVVSTYFSTAWLDTVIANSIPIVLRYPNYEYGPDYSSAIIELKHKKILFDSEIDLMEYLCASYKANHRTIENSIFDVFIIQDIHWEHAWVKMILSIPPISN